MSETIKDGRGTGNRAKVDGDGRLQTHSTMATAMMMSSDYHGRAFSLPAMNYALGTADQEYNLLWFRNDDPEYSFHINRFYIGYNGGDTNKDRVLDARMYVGAAVPTANHVAFSPGNLNFTSSRAAVATAYLWDGVSTGMTISSQGTKSLSQYFAAGMTTVEVDGTIIVGYDQTILFTATPEETGKASVIISGWYHAHEE